jgi:hypothetical protein
VVDAGPDHGAAQGRRRTLPSGRPGFSRPGKRENRGVFPKRNVGLVPFGFTRASAERTALHLVDYTESEIYAAWYWTVNPRLRDLDHPAHKRPVPDGIAVWTSRRVLLIELEFTWGTHWITEARVVHEFPTGEPLPVSVTSGTDYDCATIHGELYWFVHGRAPSQFD